MTSREEHYRALSTRLLKDDFAPRLRELVKRRTQGSKKITLTDLAIRIGYDSITGLQAVMNGKAQPSLHRLIGLAVELELHSLEELFGDFGTASAVVDEKT